MAQLKDRDDVDWRRIEEAHRAWDFSAQGLNPAAAMVITIAVSAATAGSGAALIGAAQGTLQAAVANAALTSLASQAAVAFVGNQGNLGATFKQLASAETVRSLAIDVLMAGQSGSSSGSFVAKAATAGKRALIRTALDATIGGRDFNEALRGNLISAATNTIGAELAGQIGVAAREAAKNGTSDGVTRFAQLAAHAALGCASSAAAGGNCGIGAAGSAAGELIALTYVENWVAEQARNGTFQSLPEEQKQAQINELMRRGVTLAGLSAALVAGAAGGDAATVSATVNSAQTAAENNALCGGFCIAALVATAAYLLRQGEGDPYQGLVRIGKGEDPFSRALQSGVAKTVALSQEQFPEETTAVLRALAAVDEGMTDVLFYVDDHSGQVVSKTWNGLTEDQRNAIRGGIAVADVLTAVISPAGVAQVAKLKNVKVNLPPKNATAATPLKWDGLNANGTGRQDTSNVTTGTLVTGAQSSKSAAHLRMQLSAEQAAGVRMPTEISGYTRHGLNRVISRDGVGVSGEAILETWKNPLDIKYTPTSRGPTFLLKGDNSVIVVSPEGKIVTAWPTNRIGKRLNE